MPSVAYAVHTRACTYLLDDEGICRWVLSRRGTATDDRCVGAQFVACIDTNVEGGLVGELRPGSSALFVGLTEGRLALLRTKPILLVEVPTDGAALGPLEETADLPGEAVPIHPALVDELSRAPAEVATRHDHGQLRARGDERRRDAQRAEHERLEQALREHERREHELREQELREHERLERERMEHERLEHERREHERAEHERHYARLAEEARHAEEHARHVELVREREAAVLRADQERRAAEAEARRLAEEWQRAQEEAEARRRAAQEAWIQRRLLDAQRLDREAHPAGPPAFVPPAPEPPPSIDELAMTTPRADRDPPARPEPHGRGRAPLPPLAPPPVGPSPVGLGAALPPPASPPLALHPARAGSGWSVRPPEPVPFDPRVTSERLELSEDDLVELDPEELSKEITLTNPLFRKPRGA